MKKKNKNHGFLTDGHGKPSHTRLLVVLCVPVLIFTPLFVWVYICISKLTFVGIDATVPLYIGTANGIILGYAGFKSTQETSIQSLPPPPAPKPKPPATTT